jgi:hydrogenase maturation protease
MQTLVIGIGHPDRGDDAIGRIVARQLNRQAPDGVMVFECDGEAARLLDLLEGADEVVIIDAAASGAEPGTIHRLDAVAGALPAGMFTMSTHSMGLAHAIELARTLGQLPKRCIICNTLRCAR